MQTSKTKPASRRLSLGLVVWLVLSISVVQIPFATLTTPAIASPTLDPALEQAVKTEIITQHPTAASTHIIVSPINQVKAWVFGSTAIIPQPASTAETDDETVPLILLFLAEQQASG